MLKLCNFTNYPAELKMFQPQGVAKFLDQQQLDGVEMLFGQEWNARQLPREKIIGIHLPFYASWLDFWYQDTQALTKNFGSLQQAYQYYGGTHPEVLVNTYCTEIQRAIGVGAKYVVFHVSHVRPWETLSYQFAATDEQVIKASAVLINEVFRQLDTDICLLLENLWWPGLTFCDKEMAILLLDSVEHANKGFMLDTGHLMNTCTSLTSQQAGVDYILSRLDSLGEITDFIQGIHLHYSLSGQYVRHADTKLNGQEHDKVMEHVLNIDQHLPFSHRAVRNILAYVQPKYLVHEFMCNTKQQLSDYLGRQSRAVEGEIEV